MTDIKEILEEGGWYTGRKIDVDDWILQLKNNRLTPPNITIIEFLSEFGNIEYSFMLPSGEFGNVKLVADEILPYVEPSSLHICERLVDEPIVPIGTIFNDTAYLYMSYSGKFYMSGEGKLYLLANNFIDCLDVVKNQKDILRIK